MTFASELAVHLKANGYSMSATCKIYDNMGREVAKLSPLKANNIVYRHDIITSDKKLIQKLYDKVSLLANVSPEQQKQLIGIGIHLEAACTSSPRPRIRLKEGELTAVTIYFNGDIAQWRVGCSREQKKAISEIMFPKPKSTLDSIVDQAEALQSNGYPEETALDLAHAMAHAMANDKALPKMVLPNADFSKLEERVAKVEDMAINYGMGEERLKSMLAKNREKREESLMKKFVHPSFRQQQEAEAAEAKSEMFLKELMTTTPEWQRLNPLTDEYECEEPDYPTQRETINQLNTQLKRLGYYARNNGTSTESIGIRSHDGGWQGSTRKIATLFKNAPMNWLSEATEADKQNLKLILPTGEDIMSPQDACTEAQNGTKQTPTTPLRLVSRTFLGEIEIQEWEEEDFIKAVTTLNEEKAKLIDAMGGIKSTTVAAKIEEIENTILTIVDLLDKK